MERIEQIKERLIEGAKYDSGSMRADLVWLVETLQRTNKLLEDSLDDSLDQAAIRMVRSDLQAEQAMHKLARQELEIAKSQYLNLGKWMRETKGFTEQAIETLAGINLIEFKAWLKAKSEEDPPPYVA